MIVLTLKKLREIMEPLKGAPDSTPVSVIIREGNSTSSTLLVSAKIGRSIFGDPQLQIEADNTEDCY